MRQDRPSLAFVTDPTTAWISLRIKQARKQLGWTQAELAEQLDRTQTAISYWEAGKRKPGLDDVMDLAAAMHREVAFFLPPAAVRQPVATVLRAELERLGSEELAQAVDAILGETELDEIPDRKFRVGARQPAHAANELLEAASVTEPPVPVEELIGGCGVLLHRKELPDALSGLLVEMAQGALIAVNDRHARTRQRFTLCHELGHHLLGHTERFHLNLTEGAPAQDYRLERAANEFAADVLMPRKLLAEVGAANIPTHELAELFDVSEVAMGYRVLNLGIR
jgi:transcriptional regulator with XRE-family HTH domain